VSVEEIISQSKNELNEVMLKLSKKIEEEFSGSMEKQRSIEEELSKVKAEREEWKQKFEESDQKIKKIEGQLQETVTKLEEVSKDKDKKIDMLELLDIYLALVNNVFESSTHVRILLMLHGGKDSYQLDELVKSSGIGALGVKRAIHDLRNADVVSYDEETGEIILKQRFID